MATYCFRCPNEACGATAETHELEPPTCKGSDGPHLFTLRMVRDYRAESFAIGPNVLVSKRSLANLADVPPQV